jgi:signal transduction histidine kinase
MWLWLLEGLILGIALMLPLAWWWTRRNERRVRALEARARSAERLAELGTLTGGLAHEIKNPLSTLGLNVQLLQEDLHELTDSLPGNGEVAEKTGRLDRRLGALARETQRLRDILEDFLRFAGRVQLEKQPTDVNELLSEVADFFAPQAEAARVHLRSRLADGLPSVFVDASLLKQAILNLMINATQAMQKAREKQQPHGGADELILSTARRRADGQAVEVRVMDTGPGMSAEVKEKVFQPYFSTRRGGTGLGLPIARRIVDEHGGNLSVHSEPGRGTEFILTLPVEAAPEA